MISHVPRLPFSLDPLIAEAKRRARKRRYFLALIALVVVALAAGFTLGFPSPGAGQSVLLFRVPSSSMEPTLNCAKPGPGCLGTADDLVQVQPGKTLKRKDIVAYKAPSKAAATCAAMSGVFIKRVIGLPGETVHEDNQGFFDINGKRLTEPYLSAPRRLADTMHFDQTWHVPKGDYFLVGDNRALSCDSRTWGPVPARNVIGPAVKIIHGG